MGSDRVLAPASEKTWGDPGSRVPPPRNLFVRTLMAIAGRVARCLWKIEAHGLEHIPADGPYILCANHQSWFDSLLVAIWLDRRDRRTIACFAKRELFESLATRWVTYCASAIPIDRGGNASAALRAGCRILEDGRPMFIHPEGTRTRTGSVGPFLSGAAHLSLRTQSPLVPVRIEGTFELCPPTRAIPRLFDLRRGRRFRIRVHFGAPIQPSRFGGSNQNEGAMTEALRNAVLALGDDDTSSASTARNENAEVSSIDANSVFLVSGGARGITARCVVEMAKAFRCGFVLLGRSPVSETEPTWALGCETESELTKRLFAAAEGQGRSPREIRDRCRGLLAQREIRRTLESIASTGGRAQYLQVDVTDSEALKRAMNDAAIEDVTGILHGAGRLSDKRIKDKTADDFDTVFNTKVNGLEHLLACVPRHQLRHLILFSSAAGFFGNVGQSDYAFANEVLNRMASWVRRSRPQCQVLSLNWGPWDGGMVTPELKEHFQARNIPLIPIDEGARILVDTARRRVSGNLVVGSRLPRPEPVDTGSIRNWRVVRKLSLEANPFLKDHVIGGVAVLPTTFAVGWMGDACSMAYPDHTFFSIRDYRILKGIVFDDEMPDAFLLELQEIRADREEVVIDAQISSAGSEGRTRCHYRAEVTLRRNLPTPIRVPFSVPEITADSHPIPHYHNGVLFHGPSLQGISDIVTWSATSITVAGKARRVTDAFQGQFRFDGFNPFAADIAYQAVLIWARDRYGAASLPRGSRSGQQYRPVPFDRTFYVSMDLVDEMSNCIRVDLTTYDENGSVYNIVRGAEVTLNKKLNPLFLQRRLA